MMKLVIHKPKEKIRMVVISFSLFIALMLFQTAYMRLGMLTASVAILLTIATYFWQGKGLRGKIVLNINNTCILLFLLHSVFLTLIKGMLPSGFIRFVAQIILCILLFSVELNQREHGFLKKVFVFAAAFYAVLIIQSYYVNTRAGYYHQDVKLFNTEFDPNYIGIPLVAATVLLLDNILHRKWWKCSVAGYILIITAIIYTASRGSFVSLICSNLFVFAFFFFRQDIHIRKKILLLLVPVVGMLILIPIFSTIFPNEWARITTYSANSDNGRFENWAYSLKKWWEHPFFGNGLGSMYVTSGWASHNTYLQILSETGLLGFTLATAFVIPMLKKAFKRDTAIFCVLVGVLVQIAFLDAVDNRCVWIVMSWIAMLPSQHGELFNEKDIN